MRWARKMLFAAILSICALSSKKISIYNEEMIVARCFIGFIIFSRKSLGNTFKATLDGRIQAIQEESQQFPNPNEVVPPESNEQQRLLRISLRICGTVVESLPMARYAPKCEKTVQALLCRNQNVKSATLPNATSSRRIRLKDSLVTIKLRSERRLKVCIPFLLLIPPLLFFYILCLKLGELSFFLFVLSKGAGLVGGKALSFILTKMGCSSTLASVIGSAFRALVTTEARPSLAHCMLPGSSQQPAAGEEVPQDALRDHPVATRSAPPGDIEVKQPLMGDHEREMELQDRLNRHFIGTEVDSMRYNDLIDKQVLIEKRIEMALLNDLYTRERILANRYDIRECLFYKNGAPLKESTLDLYLKEIQNDLRGSVPFRKIENEIRNYNLFLK